jgi:hypothetical protein
MTGRENRHVHDLRDPALQVYGMQGPRTVADAIWQGAALFLLSGEAGPSSFTFFFSIV